MINPKNNSNIDWFVGDKVNSIEGKWKDGEVIGIEFIGSNTILEIKWSNEIIQKRSDRIVEKIK